MLSVGTTKCLKGVMKMISCPKCTSITFFLVFLLIATISCIFSSASLCMDVYFHASVTLHTDRKEEEKGT